MTEQQKPVLTVEQFTRAYLDLAEKCPQYQPANLDEFWVKMANTFLSTDEKSLAAQQKFEQERKTLPESVNVVLDVFKSVAGNPEQTTEVVNITKLVLSCYVDRGENETNLTRLNIFINRIKRFQDKALAYKAAEKIKKFWLFKHPQTKIRPDTTDALYREIAYFLANSEYATTEDIADLIYFCPTFDEARQILNAVCASADKQLASEMSKEVPDIAKIRNITHYVRECMRVILDSMQFADAHKNNPELRHLYHRDMSPAEMYAISEEFRKLKEIIYKKYDTDTIFASDNPKFTKQFDESIMTKFLETQKENDALRQENERLTEANEQAHQQMDAKDVTIDKAYSQIERLNARIRELELDINAEQGKVDNAKATIKLLRGQIKMLITAAEQVRGGLGAKGIKELQATIEKVSAKEI